MFAKVGSKSLIDLVATVGTSSATTESRVEPDGSLLCPTPSPSQIPRRWWLPQQQPKYYQAHLLGVNIAK